MFYKYYFVSFYFASSNAWRRVPPVPGDIRQSEILIEQDFKIWYESEVLNKRGSDIGD